MKRNLASALLLTALIASAAHAQVSTPSNTFYDDGGSSGRGATAQHRYAGGPNTLPYGHVAGFDLGLAAHAQTMPAVQYAMQRMSERGYLRRADGDMGCTIPGYAVAVLTYEKPGAAIGDAFPAVLVHTKPYYVNSRLKWVPVTQVVCGVFRDSAGVLVPSGAAADTAQLIAANFGPAGVAGEVTRAMLGARAENCPECLAMPQLWAFTTFEFAGMAVQYWFTQSPGQRYLNEQYAQRMGISIAASAAGYGARWAPPPFGSGWQGGVYSMAIAATAAHYNFMLSPPDTSGVHP